MIRAVTYAIFAATLLVMLPQAVNQQAHYSMATAIMIFFGMSFAEFSEIILRKLLR